MQICFEKITTDVSWKFDNKSAFSMKRPGDEYTQTIIWFDNYLVYWQQS